jgi:pimeloyl-ACP methyl ester carboxylesterase
MFMDTDRVHRAVSIDGTEIAARVRGDGPPLVLVPGGPGDGEFSFRFLLPHLADHVTCYPVSTRSKGLSGTNENYSLDLLEGDLRSFVESLGEPVALMGWSSACPLVLEVTAKSEAVSAVVLYEPTFLDLRPPEVEVRHQAGIERMLTAMGEGHLLEAARAFYEDLAMADERELAALEAAGTFEQSAQNIPVMMQEALGGAVGVMSDVELLEQISIPVLLLYGTASQPFYASVVDHLVERLPDPFRRQVEGVGHFAPALAPELVAAETLRFLSDSSFTRSSSFH